MTISVLKAAGLYTSPNQYGDVPEGSLVTASNVIIKYKNIIQPRRGQGNPFGTTFGSGSDRASAFTFWGNYAIVQYGTSLAYFSRVLPPVSATAYSGSYSPAVAYNSRMRFVEANGNLYFNTTLGTKVITTIASDPVSSGVPRALDPAVVSSGGAGNAVGADSKVGFRVVWGIKDANKNVKLGAPSGRVVLANTSGASIGASVTIPIPSGITTSHFYRVYQTVDSATATTDPGDECFQCYSAVSPGTSGTFTITVSQPQTLLGDPLYTNPKTGDGILASNDQPPASSDLALWNGRVWWGRTIQRDRLSLEMIGVGATTGVQDNDTITVAGVTYRAKTVPALATDFLITSSGSAEANVEATTKALVNLINTYSGNTTVYAYYESGENEATGKFRVETRAVSSSGSGTFTVAFSRAASWNAVSGTSDPVFAPNGIAYSKFNEPESVPLVNYLTVGSKDKGIIRIFPLRDRLFVFKEDGIYVISGEVPSLRVDLFDSTTVLIAANSLAAVNNQIYGLTNQGVVAISEGGVGVVSKPIDRDLEYEMAESLVSNTYLSGFKAWGAGHESQRLYMLGLDYANTESSSKVWVFNVGTNAWTTWAMNRTCALNNSFTDALWLGSGSSNELVYERHGISTTIATYDASNSVTITSGTSTTAVLVAAGDTAVGDALYITATESCGIVTAVNGNTVTTTPCNTGTWAAGAAVVRKAFPVTLEWASQYAGAPSNTKQFREVSLHFGQANFYAAKATFRTDHRTTKIRPNITCANFDANQVPDVDDLLNVRVLVPLEMQRGTYSRVGFQITEALSSWALNGYSMEAAPVSERNGR